MPRYVIDGYPISVAFGYEKNPSIANVFLSVSDERLRWKESAGEAVNNVCNAIESSGSGFYLQLYTGAVGFGQKVDHETMAVFLKRYGVSEEQIAELPLLTAGNKERRAALSRNVAFGSCATCGQAASKRCGRCHEMSYCSDACQRAGWKSHKIFCVLFPFPPPPPADDAVIGILLPENDKTPRVVKVPLKHVDDEDGPPCAFPAHDAVRRLLGRDFGSGLGIGETRSDYLTGGDFASLPFALHLKYGDGFLRDGSTMNDCVAHLLEKEFDSVHWHGSVLVVRSRDSGFADPVYESMCMTDTAILVQFLRAYERLSLTGIDDHRCLGSCLGVA